MKNSTIILTLVLSLSMFISSCGKAAKKEKKSSQKQLETGTSFLNAPNNWVQFGTVRKNSVYVQSLYFSAIHDGRLSLSIATYGLGRGCLPGEDNSFKLDYKFRVKSKVDSEFKIVEKDPRMTNPTVTIKEGDSLVLDIALHSTGSCIDVEVPVMAVF